MKKNNKKGFFLSETVIIIAIVTMVLLGVFKIFSAVYSKYKERENYDTTNATNVVTSMKKYYESKGLDYVVLLNDNFYVELTNSDVYDSEYYDKLKEITEVENIYLFDMDQLFTDSNINTFDISLRKYLKTWKNNIEVSVMLVAVLNGGEYGSVPIKTNQTVTLVGDGSDEFSTVVPLNGSYTEPGYLNWEGDPPTTEWEIPLDTTKEGTYYLHYNFDGYILRRKVIVGVHVEFDYTGDVQTFIVPVTGYYKLEVWGAQGGDANATYRGGYGGYSKGEIYLQKDQTLYVYIGNKPSSTIGGYNGGGNGVTNNYAGHGGGGAAHIATSAGLLSTLSANQSAILIVAGGGGGGVVGDDNNSTGGQGGGYIGGTAISTTPTYTNPTGGTQTAGGTKGILGTNGSFGQGGNGSSWSGGGGGGFYGGGGGYGTGGGGGSGYIGNSNLINKSMYCYNCTTSSTTSTLTYSTTNVSDIATANYTKSGNGYAKIALSVP